MMNGHGQYREHRVFSSAVGDTRIGMIDVRDFAEVAVKTLTEQGHDARLCSDKSIYEVHGLVRRDWRPEAFNLYVITRRTLLHVSVTSLGQHFHHN